MRTYAELIEYASKALGLSRRIVLVSSNLGTAVVKDEKSKKIYTVYKDADPFTLEKIEATYFEVDERNEKVGEYNSIHWSKKTDGWKHSVITQGYSRYPNLYEAVQLLYKYRCGNCLGMSKLVYLYFISELDDVSVELIRLDIKHVFVVIGRLSESDLQDYSTWGENAVICDPWLNLVCRANQYLIESNKILDNWEENYRVIFDETKKRWVFPSQWKDLANLEKVIMYNQTIDPSLAVDVLESDADIDALTSDDDDDFVPSPYSVSTSLDEQDNEVQQKPLKNIR